MANFVVKQGRTQTAVSGPSMRVPTGRGLVEMATVALMPTEAAVATLKAADKTAGQAYAAIVSLIAPREHEVMRAASVYANSGDVKAARKAASTTIGNILAEFGIAQGRNESGNGSTTASQYRSRIAAYLTAAGFGAKYQIGNDKDGEPIYRELSLLNDDGRAVPVRMLDTVQVEKNVDEVAQAHIQRARAVLKSAYESLYGDRLRGFWQAVEESEEYQTLMLAVSADSKRLPADVETDAANNGTVESAA